jgi:hypothetical protein
MTRLFAGLIVLALVSPAFGGDSVAQDKNWGDKQTQKGNSKAPAPTKTKEPKLPLEKEKITPMKDERS